MKRAGLILALLAGAASAAHAGTGPVVAVDGGRIEGERMADGKLAFRAVPFAAPPVGQLRWRPPAPVRAWAGVRPALTSAPACAQLSDGWNKAQADHSSEDCLYLEIGTPTLKPDRPMPVLVWIHGGSNKAGGGAGTIGSAITQRGIVLVSIQYRLGALGFMAHPALSAESRWHASGNWGLLDQQAALRWVRRNVASFGGDPGNVTIAGESAGSQDVGLQTLSPLARGLYAKAIEESGTPSFGFDPRDLATAERYGTEIAAAAGARAQTAAALRALPVAAILRAERAVHYPGLYENGTVWLQTTIDGHVIPDDPRRLLEEGRVNPGPLIIGSNARELQLSMDLPKALAAVRHVWGANADRALAAYRFVNGRPPADDPRLGDPVLRIATDIVFRCPSGFVAAERVRAGQPTWQYQFDYRAPGGPAVTHGSEIRYVMGRAGEGDVAAGGPPLQDYWLNFMFTGDPNGTGLPFWPAFDLAHRSYASFGQSGVTAGEGLAADTCGMLARP